MPFTLSSQVPLWTAIDVKHWLQQVSKERDFQMLSNCCRDNYNLTFVTVGPVYAERFPTDMMNSLKC